MKIATKTDFEKLVHDSVNAVNLMLTIEAPEPDDSKKRNPLALVMMIDRSGSMDETGGSKSGATKLSQAKRSAYKLIDNLTDADSLGLVFFDDRVEFVPFEKMTSGGKEKMKKEIAGLNTRGCTDIGSAMRQAVEMFNSFEGPVGGVERILLLTDGQANRGAQTIEQMMPIVAARRGGVGVSCFGYGLGFNENLLAAISERGKGGNYFIESPDSCSQAFAVELGGLLTCYAQKVRAAIKTHKGATVSNVLNDFNVETKQDADGDLVTYIDIDDVYCGETRHVLVRLSCDKRPDALPRPQTLADVTVKYVKLSDGSECEEQGKVKVQFVKKAEEADKEPDKKVAEQVALLEAAHVQIEAKKLADLGQWQTAQNLCRESSVRLKKFGTADTMAFASAVDGIADGYNVSYSSQTHTAKSATSLGVGMLRARRSSLAGSGERLGSMGCYTVSMQSMMSSFDDKGADPAAAVDIQPDPGALADASPAGYTKSKSAV